MQLSASSERQYVTYALPVGPLRCTWLNGVLRLTEICEREGNGWGWWD